MFQYRCVLYTSQELQDVKNAVNGIFAAVSQNYFYFELGKGPDRRLQPFH